MFEKCQVVRGWEVCSVVSMLAVVHKHNLASHYSDDNSFFYIMFGSHTVYWFRSDTFALVFYLHKNLKHGQ